MWQTFCWYSIHNPWSHVWELIQIHYKKSILHTRTIDRPKSWAITLVARKHNFSLIIPAKNGHISTNQPIDDCCKILQSYYGRFVVRTPDNSLSLVYQLEHLMIWWSEIIRFMDFKFPRLRFPNQLFNLGTHQSLWKLKIWKIPNSLRYRKLNAEKQRYIRNMIIIGHHAVLDVPRLLQAYLGPFCVFLCTFLCKLLVQKYNAWQFCEIFLCHTLTLFAWLRILTSPYQNYEDTIHLIKALQDA